ncbi:unnamed protein product [Clonostachys chloroleuca]|uniref:Uncharacterized protein n=1 Tax=Clonostachys chloroleuca TaxID=1926264 RepID=A0AA35Q9H1_9HYPO|nr:unnamed protein product [Clonostachys chloroleuca]
MAELKPYRGDYCLWLYLPSTIAGAIFTTLFFLSTAFVAWRMIKPRAWFCTVFIIDVQVSTFTLVSPALFAAFVYMVLARIIHSLNAESLSVIPVMWLTTIFVAGDVISFTVQASGAGIMAVKVSIKDTQLTCPWNDACWSISLLTLPNHVAPGPNIFISSW